jgi:large subunit ribosomal protein L10
VVWVAAFLMPEKGNWMARPEKTQAVEEITTRFQESTAALLTEYRGLSVTEIAELRGALREADADYKVLKNTLARIAAREVGMEDLVGMLEGPTAIAFCKGDAVTAAKALDDAAKKFPVLVIKGGVLRGKMIDAAQTKALASLEPREVQLAKIAMMMNQPLQLTVNVFAAALRDLGSMLAQVVAKKESGELPGGSGEPAAETAPAEEAPAETAPAETAPAEEAPAEETPAETAPAEEAAAPDEAPAAEAASADDAPVAESGDETGDRGEAEVADAVAGTASDTSGDAAESVEASNDTEQDSTTDEAAAGGDEKEE